MLPAFILFLVAGVSDGVDGFIAKRFNQETELGAYLDPLADKALLVSIYVALGVLEYLPSWLVILVVSRDVLIIGAVMLSWIMGRPVEMAPVMTSKVNTTAQILLVVFVLADLAFDLQLNGLHDIGVWAVAIFTVSSGAIYLMGWLKEMANIDEGSK
jgi:cardiolipin synthase